MRVSKINDASVLSYKQGYFFLANSHPPVTIIAIGVAVFVIAAVAAVVVLAAMVYCFRYADTATIANSMISNKNIFHCRRHPHHKPKKYDVQEPITHAYKMEGAHSGKEGTGTDHVWAKKKLSLNRGGPLKCMVEPLLGQDQVVVSECKRRFHCNGSLAHTLL
jgi:hypothetical protein